MHHVPGNLSTGSHPRFFVKNLVAFNTHVWAFDYQVTVELCGSCLQFFVIGKTAGRFFYYSKCFGMNLLQNFFNLFITLFFELVNLLVGLIFLLNLIFS